MGSRAIKGRHNVKKKTGVAIILSIIAIIVACIGAAAFGMTSLVSTWLEDLPDYEDSEALNTSSTSVVYASDGETVLAEFQLENREPVELDQISEYVKECTVATEDERFYSHSGVDFYGTARSLVNNLLGGSLEGGSTITQQLVRNTILSDEANDISFKRKIREMYIAFKIEELYSKDEILLMYLNTINYGSGAYGIQAAAERYYSKDAKDLTLAESATLVGIPQSPTYNNPIDHIDNCFSRRNVVIDRALSNGYITTEEAASAKSEEVVLDTTSPSTTGIVAYPYFTSYVRNQLLNEDGKYAYSAADLFKGGYEIVTTLDVDQQTAANEAAEKKMAEAGGDFEVAMAAIEPETGHITSMIGGYDYDESQVNMATGEGSSGRQCGSSFKTFTLAAAIEAGISPETMIDAGYSVEIEGSDAVVYNAGKSNYGTVSISKAFEVSSNTAFTRLILSVGVDKVKKMAQRLGVKSPLQDVAGITLGIDSLTPLEMASAYATIANGGTYYEPECILQIRDRSGNVIIDNSQPEGERVISEEVACATIDVMKGVVENGTGRAARLDGGREAAGKTGTTDDSKDSWFVGFTPQLSAAFWMGDRAESYEKAKVVPTTVASAFSTFMNKALKGQPNESFKTADDPYYDMSYLDTENHVGKGYWGSADDEEEDDSSSSSSAAESSSSSSSAASSSSSASSSGATSEGGSGAGGEGAGGSGGAGTGGGTGAGGTGAGGEGGSGAGGGGGTTSQP